MNPFDSLRNAFASFALFAAAFGLPLGGVTCLGTGCADNNRTIEEQRAQIDMQLEVAEKVSELASKQGLEYELEVEGTGEAEAGTQAGVYFKPGIKFKSRVTSNPLAQYLQRFLPPQTTPMNDTSAIK